MVVAGVRFRTLAFIDGEFVPAAGGQTYLSENPATGRPLAEVALGGTEDVDRAVGAARRAFEDGRWSDAYSEGDLSTPFGGFKQSGFGGHDKSVHAHDKYTELKTIWIDMSEPGA